MTGIIFMVLLLSIGGLASGGKVCAGFVIVFAFGTVLLSYSEGYVMFIV
jgi:hypothetical protein